MSKNSAVPPEGQGPQSVGGSQTEQTPQVPKAAQIGYQQPQMPRIPLVANLINFGDRLTRMRSMLDPCLKMIEPADGTLSVLAVAHFVDAGKKNNLGTLTPSEALVGIDDFNRYLYMIPVPSRTPGATKLRYKNGQIQINLYEAFAKNDRLVFPDVREYYDVRPTPGEVTIVGVYTGWGIYVDLHDVVKEPIQRLSDEEKAARAAKAAQTKAAKEAKKKQQKDPAPSTDADAETEEESS